MENDNVDFAWDDTIEAQEIENLFSGGDDDVVESEAGKTVEKVTDVTVESEEDFLTLKDSESAVKETKQNEVTDTGDKNENIEGGTEDNENSNEVDNEDADDVAVYRSLANDLKTNGIITSDFTEEEITDGESFLEVFEKEVNSRLEEEVKNYAESFDDDGRAYLEYIKNGGTTVDFVKLFIGHAELPVESVDTPEKQEAFLRYYLKTIEGDSEEDTEDQIEVLKESNKLEKRANAAFKKVNGQLEAVRNEKLKQQAEFVKADEKRKTDFVVKLSETVKDKKAIGDFDLSNTDKKGLVEFIAKATVNVGGRKVTAMQAKLNEIYQNPEKLIILAKLVKSDFDLTDVIKKAETKVVKKSLKVISDTKKGVQKRSSGKMLAELMT